MMPTVPKLDPSIAQGDPGLLSENSATRPDAASVLMASASMASMGRLGRGAGATLGMPKKQKSTKSGSGKGVLR
jgi:hypothetical protein